MEKKIHKMFFINGRISSINDVTFVLDWAQRNGVKLPTEVYTKHNGRLLVTKIKFDY